jgi:PPOX class probable F420-dependent enzyme
VAQLDRVEIEGFAEQRLLAILTTVGPDGSPQATPVWYLYDGEHFKVTSRGDRVKVRNIRRDPRVTMVVVDTASNGDPLTVRGTAEVVEEGGEEFTYTMARRYEGKRRGDAEAKGLIELARGMGQPRVIIDITPHRVRIGD